MPERSPMNIYIYSDESGVFDYIHNRWYIFGGVILLSKKEKELAVRKYIHAEKVVRAKESLEKETEVKASKVSNKDKHSLFRSLNQVEKFGVVIDEKEILRSIFSDKKSRQRYLDFAYKIGIKRKFEHMISARKIDPDDVQNLYFFVDEHTTATNGRYELREALEQEFKHGTYNYNFSTFFPPIFPNLKSVTLTFCNSENVVLVRAADIVANNLYHRAIRDGVNISAPPNSCVTILPHERK